VGRLDPEKKIEDVLQAVALAAKTTDFCLVIVGKGIRKSALERLTEELCIRNRTIFTGLVPEEDLPYFYKLSRCFIIASIAELLSLATLQAMASGLPVIAANAGALGELVHHQINGFLFNIGDIGAMAHAVSTVVSNDELHQKMSEKSIELIRDHDLHITADLFERIYRRSYKVSFDKIKNERKYCPIRCPSSYRQPELSIGISTRSLQQRQQFQQIIDDKIRFCRLQLVKSMGAGRNPDA
jgi:glycosyltransferase involved in cell wall biosynthesis